MSLPPRFTDLPAAEQCAARLRWVRDLVGSREALACLGVLAHRWVPDPTGTSFPGMPPGRLELFFVPCDAAAVAVVDHGELLPQCLEHWQALVEGPKWGHGDGDNCLAAIDGGGVWRSVGQSFSPVERLASQPQPSPRLPSE